MDEPTPQPHHSPQLRTPSLRRRTKLLLLIGITALIAGFTVGPAVAATVTAQYRDDQHNITSARYYGYTYTTFNNSQDEAYGSVVAEYSNQTDLSSAPGYLGLRVSLRHDSGAICRRVGFNYNQAYLTLLRLYVRRGTTSCSGNYQAYTEGRYWIPERSAYRSINIGTPYQNM